MFVEGSKKPLIIFSVSLFILAILIVLTQNNIFSLGLFLHGFVNFCEVNPLEPSPCYLIIDMSIAFVALLCLIPSSVFVASQLIRKMMKRIYSWEEPPSL